MQHVGKLYCNSCRQWKPKTEFYARPTTQCKECNKAACKAWFARNKGMHSVYSRRAKLKSKYGMTIEAYTAMMQAQDFCCAMCDEKFELGGLKDPVIDHDHKTDAVRAIVCRRCNLIIGHANDDVAYLEKALAYLKRFVT